MTFPSDLPRGTSQKSSETSHASQKADYADWLTKPQAAEAIGVSTKTIETLAKEGQLQQAVYRPQNRGPAKAVYHPEDVARIARERQPGPRAFVLPVGVKDVSTGNGNHAQIQLSTPKEVSPTGEEILRLVFTAALQRLTSEKSAHSENSEKGFLTIPEAAAVSGLSQAHLRRRCQSGWPGAIKDGAWKIRRKDLEAL